MSFQNDDDFKVVSYKKNNQKFIKNKQVNEKEDEIKNLYRKIHSPKVDLIDRNSVYFIRIELPGVEKSSIKIDVKDNQIVFISGKKYIDNISNTDKIIYKESKYNDFTRRIKLPSLILNEYDNDFDFKDGVLRITFQKSETTQNTQENTQKEINFDELSKGVSWADM